MSPELLGSTESKLQVQLSQLYSLGICSSLFSFLDLARILACFSKVSVCLVFVTLTTLHSATSTGVCLLRHDCIASICDVSVVGRYNVSLSLPSAAVRAGADDCHALLTISGYV